MRTVSLLLLSMVMIIAAANVVYAKSRYAECFRKTIRRAISNSQPTMELFYLSPSQCIDHCIFALNTNTPKFETCQSFVYDHRRHSCKLYNHDGFKPPAIVHPANGYDFYRRTASADKCADFGAPKQFRPSPTNPNLYILHQTTNANDTEDNSIATTTAAQITTVEKTIPDVDDAEYAATQNTISANSVETSEIYGRDLIDATKIRTGNRTATIKPNIYEQVKVMEEQIARRKLPKNGVQQKIKKTKGLPPPRMRNVQIIENHSATVDKDDFDLIENISGENNMFNWDKPDTKTTATVDTTSKQFRIDDNSQCKTSTAYYVVIGNEIILPISSTEGDVRTLNGLQHSDCAKMCTANQGPNGERIKCSSINYFPVEKKCELYGILAEPHGPGSLVENDQAIYAEKFCLPTQSVICDENEAFVLHVQKRIAKIELKTKSSNSITNCLRHCLEHRMCQTAVFDSIHRRCMLYDITLNSADDVMDADSGWVLIENGCSKAQKKQKTTEALQKKRKQYAETEWTEWSSCQFKLRGRMVKVRTRQCESAECSDGGMQIQRC